MIHFFDKYTYYCACALLPIKKNNVVYILTKSVGYLKDQADFIGHSGTVVDVIEPYTDKHAKIANLHYPDYITPAPDRSILMVELPNNTYEIFMPYDVANLLSVNLN